MLDTGRAANTMRSADDAQPEAGDALICPKCGKEFRAPAVYRRHLERKTPCDPIAEAPGRNNSCRFCGKDFATRASMCRHVRQYCRIANSDEGMARLMDHTLRRQLAEQSAKTDALAAQVAELATLLRGQPPLSTTNVAVRIGSLAQVNTGPVTNINVRLWGGEDRICIPASMLRAAFTENPRLVEYCRMSDVERVDVEQAAPYVVEALMELVRRAHTAPESRNVYLNPRRADQVLVYDESWSVLPLVEAIGDLFDSVAGRIHRIIVSDTERRQLPVEVQAAAAWVPNLYEEDRDGIVRRARAPMAAHLANTSPAISD